MLVQSLPPKTLHTMTETSLYQGIVHLQAATHKKDQVKNAGARTTGLSITPRGPGFQGFKMTNLIDHIM